MQYDKLTFDARFLGIWYICPCTIFSIPEKRKKILILIDPKQQYYLGKNLKPDESQWNDQISKQTMKEGVNAKFAQCSTLKNDLLDTKDKLIIQRNPYDTMWSNGLKMNDENVEDSTKWKGQNLLRKIVCEVREALK